MSVEKYWVFWSPLWVFPGGCDCLYPNGQFELLSSLGSGMINGSLVDCVVDFELEFYYPV